MLLLLLIGWIVGKNVGVMIDGGIEAWFEPKLFGNCARVFLDEVID